MRDPATAFLIALLAMLILGIGPVDAASPVMVRDIDPTGDSHPEGFAHIGTTLYFWATTPLHNGGLGGRELWRSDGTAGGTKQVAEINPLGSAYSYYPWQAVIGGTLYFTAQGSLGGVELWKTDGTAAGTKRVKDIRPGPDGSEPEALVRVGQTLYFTANDGSHGRELWKSDGTAAGTTMVEDISQGTTGPEPRELTAVGSTLFFTDEDAHGRELWKSDGTTLGTRRVEDLRPGPIGSDPMQLEEVAGRLFFSTDDGVHGIEPWVSDGTWPGTHLIKDINAGTADSLPGSFTELAGGDIFAGVAIFSAQDDGHGFELWRSDGTTDGTKRVKDIDPGPDSSDPSSFISMGDGWAIFATFGDPAVWRSDGTARGTSHVEDLSAWPYWMTRAGDRLVFGGHSLSGREPWESDGTAVGTKRIKDVRPGAQSSLPNVSEVPAVFHWVGARATQGGTAYFYADDGVHGSELWKYVP